MAIVGLKKISPLKLDPLTAISVGTSLAGLFGAGKARKASRRKRF